MTQVVISSTDDSAYYVGDRSGTGVTRFNLSELGLSNISSIRIEDDNVISGGTAAASGYDLDFMRFSTEILSSTNDFQGVDDSAINYGNLQFQLGFMQELGSGNSAWDRSTLIGTDSSGVIDLDLVSFGNMDSLHSATDGSLSLGEGGAIQFQLTQSLETQDLYLYVGDAGGGNDEFRVVFSDQDTITTDDSIILKGDSSQDTIRLGEGLNLELGKGNDTLFGFDGDDDLFSSIGNDLLVGGKGNDQIDGGEGIDTSLYSSSKLGFLIQASGNLIIVNDSQGDEGIDSLLNIERLEFSDVKVAFDTGSTENAGLTARLLSAAFGNDNVNNKGFAGIGISLFDNGMTLEEVSQLAIDTGLISAFNNLAFVSAIWGNVVGGAIDTPNLQYFSQILDNNEMTQASLLAMASQTDLVGAAIQSIGIHESGLEYIIG
jgi:hypothetical protein